MDYLERIKKLAKALYPTGRAFKINPDGNFDKLISGLAASENRAYQDALSILDSALPDNANFDADDATAWEIRLGLIVNESLDIETRKLAIQRKMNHPGDIPARQNYRFLERELRAAGFDVYVYENRFDDGMGGLETRSPEVVSGLSTTVQHGDVQHGDVQHGTGVFEMVVNNIEASRDATFNLGGSLRSTFFVGGTPIGTYANVDADRKDEFRQLILRVKPTQTIGFLFVNFV